MFTTLKPTNLKARVLVVISAVELNGEVFVVVGQDFGMVCCVLGANVRLRSLRSPGTLGTRGRGGKGSSRALLFGRGSIIGTLCRLAGLFLLGSVRLPQMLSFTSHTNYAD